MLILKIIRADGDPLKKNSGDDERVKLGGTKIFQNFYVIPYLCTKLILGEVWLRSHGASIVFLTLLHMVNGESAPLRCPVAGPMTVVMEEDIRLLHDTGLSGKANSWYRE